MDKSEKITNKLNKKLIGGILKYKYPLAVILAGIIFLAFPFGSSNKSPPETAGAAASAESFDLQELERRLSGILSKCDGVGKSEVLLTQNGSIETIYEKNTELNISRQNENEQLNYQKEEQSELAMSQNGSYSQNPIIVKYNYPDITGAIVVCDGGANDKVKFEVIQAVSAVTGLNSDSISVIKMTQN